MPRAHNQGLRHVHGGPARHGWGRGFVPVPYRLGFIGDSIMQRNHSMGSTGGLALGQAVGEVNWAQALYPHFEMDTWFDASDSRYFAGMNDGVSGNKSADVLARVEALKDRRPGVVLVAIGINDVLQGVSAATAAANIEAICDYYLGFGIKVIVGTVRPAGADAIPDEDERLTELTDLNTAIRDYADATDNVTLWDAYEAYDNGSGRPISGVMSDGVHLTRTGAPLGGRSLAQVIATVIDTSYSDVPTGTSLSPNPTLTGTSGVEGGRASGDTATSWRFASSGTGTCTAVTSKDGSDKQVVTFSPQADGASAEYFLLSRSSGGVAVTPGNWIRTYARVRLSAWSGWRGVMHQSTLSIGLANTDANSVIDAPEEMVLNIIGPPHQVLESQTTVAPVLRFDIDGEAEGSGVATIEHWGIYEVPDPRPSH